MSDAVNTFNASVAKLLKEASAEDLVQILKDENSAIRLMHNNVNNNREMAEKPGAPSGGTTK